MKTSTIITFILGFFAGFAASFVLHIYWHSTKNMHQVDNVKSVSNQIWECMDSTRTSKDAIFDQWMKLSSQEKFEKRGDSLIVEWHLSTGHWNGLYQAWNISKNR